MQSNRPIDPRHYPEEDAGLLHRYFLAEESKPKEEKEKIFRYQSDTASLQPNILGQKSPATTTSPYNHQYPISHDFEGQHFYFTFPLIRSKETREDGTTEYTYTIAYPTYPLGNGAQGVVYSAYGLLRHDHASGKMCFIPQPLVIKTGSIIDDDALKEAKREYELTKEIHPDVKKITFEKAPKRATNAPSIFFNHPRQISRYHFVQPWHSGETLFTICDQLDYEKEEKKRRLRLSSQQFFALLIALLEALLEIHKKGIVHQDLKPGNIMVDLSTMTVKIIDFGLARRIQKRNKYALGTPLYIAPEMVAGNNDLDVLNETGMGVDVFSLGCIFRELAGDPNILSERIEPPGTMIAKRKKLYNEYNSEADNPYKAKIDPALAAQLRQDGYNVDQLLQVFSEMTIPHPADRIQLSDAFAKVKAISSKKNEDLNLIPKADKMTFPPLPPKPSIFVRNPAIARNAMIGAAIVSILALAITAGALITIFTYGGGTVPYLASLYTLSQTAFFATIICAGVAPPVVGGLLGAFSGLFEKPIPRKKIKYVPTTEQIKPLSTSAALAAPLTITKNKRNCGPLVLEESDSDKEHQQEAKQEKSGNQLALFADPKQQSINMIITCMQININFFAQYFASKLGQSEEFIEWKKTEEAQNLIIQLNTIFLDGNKRNAFQIAVLGEKGNHNGLQHGCRSALQTFLGKQKKSFIKTLLAVVEHPAYTQWEQVRRAPIPRKK